MCFASYYIRVMIAPRPAQVIAATALVCILPLSAFAASPEEVNSKAYATLITLLKQEISCLKGMTDAASAAAAQTELARILAEQAQLKQVVTDEQSFSLFVIRTDERKTEMNHLLLELTVERQRVIKAGLLID